MPNSDKSAHTALSAPLAAGSSFGDRFQIERVIGGGGMGNVYEAMDLYKRELVALKVLRFRRELMDDAGLRFRREAEVLASLDHENIIAVRDFGYASDGTPWFTMELLEGETLRDRLDRQGSLAPREVSELLTAAARGLERAHECDIIHRDLKPDHVFLVRDGSVKLLDFGLSLSLSSKRLTKKGAIVGTPRYMAPEQILSAHDADARADVYGLGVLAYEALSGASPFDASDHGQLLGAIVQGRTILLHQRRPDLPKAASEAVHRAIARQPEARYPTPGAFAEAFQVAIEKPGPGSLRRLVPWLAVGVVIATGVLALFLSSAD